MSSRSLGKGPLGKTFVTDDEGHQGIGWDRKEADQALQEAREQNREYVEKGVGFFPGSLGSKSGPSLDDDEDC